MSGILRTSGGAKVGEKYGHNLDNNKQLHHDETQCYPEKEKLSLMEMVPFRRTKLYTLPAV